MAAFERYKATMKRSLMHQVMPAITEALVAMVDERPHNVADFLSKFLIKWSDDQAAARVDPYEAPIYEERRLLVGEKARRDDERTNASIAKAQRETEAREVADASLHELLLDSMRKHASMLRS